MMAVIAFITEILKAFFMVEKAVKKTPEQVEQKDKAAVDQEQDANTANPDHRPSSDFWKGRSP